jgi:hypothetical protein
MATPTHISVKLDGGSIEKFFAGTSLDTIKKELYGGRLKDQDGVVVTTDPAPGDYTFTPGEFRLEPLLILHSWISSSVCLVTVFSTILALYLSSSCGAACWCRCHRWIRSPLHQENEKRFHLAADNCHQ